MSNTVHPTPSPYAGAGAVATSTQRPLLRKGGSSRDLHTAPSTTQGRECSPLPTHAPFPSSVRPSVRSMAGSPARSSRPPPAIPLSPRLSTSGKGEWVGIGSHFPPLLRFGRCVPSAPTSRPCSVAVAVFRPLLLPAPASVDGVGCPVFHVEQFTFVKCYFTFVKFHFTIVKCYFTFVECCGLHLVPTVQ